MAPGREAFSPLLGCLLIFIMISGGGGVGSVGSAGSGGSGGEMWPLERPDGMPAIQALEVMCGKDHMDVHLSFTQPFEGIVSSKGQYGDPRCVYVPPSTGKTFFSFRIAYARCGTKPDLHGQFYENTVVVQYDKDLLEVWDEAKRLRCEWYNDYEKTASKPPMVIADLDVIQLDFRGDNVDCWMEIQHGKGPWAPPVSGIVPLGSTLTLVVAINDYRGEFDMRVKSCAASDGGGHIIQLSDENGCVLRPKMISRFLKARINDERASVITYAFFHAFKFPDALSVHIKCKVEICRHGCLDHCQLGGGGGGAELPLEHYGPLERKDPAAPVTQHASANANDKHSAQTFGDLIYDEMLNLDDNEPPNDAERFSSIGGQQPQAQHQKRHPQTPAPPEDNKPRPFQEMPLRNQNAPVREASDRFPYGPRNLVHPEGGGSTEQVPPVAQRRRRSVVVSDRKVRSADVGVSGLYEVISEADLAFTPDSRAEAVTVFQGRIREEVVYGICLPVPGFSLLFLLVSVSAVGSALIAGSLLYRYQLQREAQQVVARHQQQQRQRRTPHHQRQQHQHQQQPHQQQGSALVVNSLASWMALRLLRARIQQPSEQQCNTHNG